MMENPFFFDEMGPLTPSTSSDIVKLKISYSDIAEKLIKDKLWLTALELHAELVEAGKEVPKLKEFFSNPNNFENQTRSDLAPTIARSSSQATLDSLDFTRFSEDGERVNDERIAVLEFELRKAKDTINALRANLTVATGEGRSCAQFEKGDVIKPHESRALNFLINEYLLLHGYKLTAITFADENEDQDFEDWDDVGLDMPKPSELLHVYRAGIRQTESVTNSVGVQTDHIEDVFAPKILENISHQEKTVEHSVDEIRSEEKEDKEVVSETSGSFEEIEVAVPEEEAVISVGSSQEESGTASPLQQLETTSNEEMWSELPRLPQLEGYDNFSPEELVLALSQHLPTMVLYLPLNNKEWLQRIVPLLVCLIALQGDPALRENLVHCLLEIKKRPTIEDRSIILSGMARACETLSEAAIEHHVLPQCWQLMSHKYPEKRALVAQVCPRISLYISVEELTLKAVTDKSDAVVKVCLRQLCPVTAKWAHTRGRLIQFMAIILSNVAGYIKEEKNAVDRDRSIVMCLRGMTACLPLFVAEEEAQNEDELSPLLLWVKDTLVPELLGLLDRVDPKREDVVVGFIKFFTSITNILGSGFVSKQVKNTVESQLNKLESSLQELGNTVMLSLIPVHTLGILTPLQLEQEVEKTIGRLIISIGLSGSSPDAMCLVARRSAQHFNLIEPLVSALWQGIVHPQAKVKVLTSKLLAEMIPYSTEQLIANRLLPPLVTLASDPDVSVRVSTLLVHTLILECCSSREVIEKCYFETGRIITDGTDCEQAPVLIAVVSAIGRMAPKAESNFREQVLLRELDKLCSIKSEEVVAALVEAFSNTVYCQMSKQVIANTLLPSLRKLEVTCQLRLPTHSETVSAMIRDLEFRVPSVTPQHSNSRVAVAGHVEDVKQKVTKMLTTPISKQTNLHNIFWKK
nr:lisH domain and HEAT repeat-containing protein KIAA1468-like [Halyomorpha halys]